MEKSDPNIFFRWNNPEFSNDYIFLIVIDKESSSEKKRLMLSTVTMPIKPRKTKHILYDDYIVMSLESSK